MESTNLLRECLARLLEWESAHTGIDKAVEGIPSGLRGVRPAGLPHSAWELVEHIRLGQHDVLEFCRDPAYTEARWPDDYWPKSPEPASDEVWSESVAKLLRDRREFQSLITDPATDLFAPVPTGSQEQTYVREVLLAADHTAYHVGQLMVVKRLLGVLPPG